MRSTLLGGNLVCPLGLHRGPMLPVLSCRETRDKVNTGHRALLQITQRRHLQMPFLSED